MKPPGADSDALKAFRAENPELDVRRFIPARGQVLDRRRLWADERAVPMPEADGWAVVRRPDDGGGEKGLRMSVIFAEGPRTTSSCGACGRGVLPGTGSPALCSVCSHLLRAWIGCSPGTRCVSCERGGILTKKNAQGAVWCGKCAMAYEVRESTPWGCGGKAWSSGVLDHAREVVEELADYLRCWIALIWLAVLCFVLWFLVGGPLELPVEDG